MNIDLFTLRVVALNDVLFHEQIEHQRVQQLLTRFESDQLLKNPPIVAPCDGKYILLDGATRTTALKHLGCRDVVVQVVDYDTPGLALETWNHLIVSLPVSDFLQSLRQLPGLQLHVATVEYAEDARVQRESIGTILFADGHALSLFGAATLPTEVALLNKIVALYEGHGELHRVAHADLRRLLAEFPHLSMVIVFPRYRPADIRRLALAGNYLPTGITRHIIPGRAMRINLPLSFLQSHEPIAEKNRWLGEWLRTRHIRYYQEPVYLLDE